MVILQSPLSFSYSHRLLAVWWNWIWSLMICKKKYNAAASFPWLNFCDCFNWFEQYYLLQGSFSYKLPADDALRGCQATSIVGDISQNSIMASTLLGSIIIFIPLTRYVTTSCQTYCSGHLRNLLIIFIGCAWSFFYSVHCIYHASFFVFSVVCELLTF